MSKRWYSNPFFIVFCRFVLYLFLALVRVHLDWARIPYLTKMFFFVGPYSALGK